MQHRWQIVTVIDITQSQANRHGDKIAKGQQANYNTVVNTASLRCNIQPYSCFETVGDITDMGFGTAITDKQRYWTFEFTHEFVDALSEEMLINDFDLVPIIKGLSDTANINISAFRTKDKADKNVIFKLLDNEKTDSGK